jgi:hypothetical protein
VATSDSEKWTVERVPAAIEAALSYRIAYRVHLPEDPTVEVPLPAATSAPINGLEPERGVLPHYGGTQSRSAGEPEHQLKHRGYVLRKDC